jgi:serine/threonine protein kinase
MGEVYRAKDTWLDRTVAIKVLPAHVRDDTALRERFERQARTIAALNHPHICTLYDVGHQDGTDFLIMEYLDGETLAQRLTKGALPLDQALTVAIQIADALDKAHRAGIVHRDLKPGNIMLTKAGAKLLDFGLAKVTPAAIAASGLSMALTGVSPVTMQGTILGTLQYMAPEQIEGQEADTRTDIFAFGAVLYEMLTGQKAFEGRSQASLIGAILKDAPPLISKLQPVAPALLDRTAMRCLAKDPDARWQTARDRRFIAFFAAAKLKKIAANGGPPQVLCDSPGTRGGAWNRDGVIVFARFWTDGLCRVSADGGTPVPVTRIDPTREEVWHRWPEFLPDGRHFLFLARSTLPGQDGIYAASLDSALTILPESFASDPDRLARFQDEAEGLAWPRCGGSHAEVRRL